MDDLLTISAASVINPINSWHVQPARFANGNSLSRRREVAVLINARLAAADGPVIEVISGPRGIGKTTALMHIVAGLLVRGISAKDILYIPMASPAVTRAGLSGSLSEIWKPAIGGAHRYLLVDDIHVIDGWEDELVRISASNAPMTVVATSGLAPEAAAHPPNHADQPPIFTHSPMTPLSFAEYLRLSRREAAFTGPGAVHADLRTLNELFYDYLNRGGFPGLWQVQDQSQSPGAGAQFVLDIVDDGTPNFAGIHDTRDLRAAFSYLVGRTGEEVSYEGVAAELGIAKNTLRKYIDYMERAGLLNRLHRVDLYAKRMERATRFKVVPASPSFYTALFGHVGPAHPKTAHLIEAATIAHAAGGAFGDRFSYASWPHGGSDHFLSLAVDGGATAAEARQVVWSAGSGKQPGGLGDLVTFCQANRLASAVVLDTASHAEEAVGGVRIVTRPASWACYLTSYYFDPEAADTSGPYGLSASY
jgi:predicted AAA+ superfamily ATPase